MPLFETSPVFHVVADSLHGSEVAQVSVFRERGGKSALRAIEELREGQLVLRALGANDCRGWPRSHQLLNE